MPRPALHGVGKSGVYLFFVLSAYLLVRNLLHQPPGALQRADTWLDYALRRALRIWPLYLVVLGLSWWTHTGGQTLFYPIDTASLWRHLALREGHSVLWSVPVEFKFYFLLPLVVVALAAMARHRWPAWLQVLAFVLVLLAVTLTWPPAESIENTVSLAPYLAVFLCGALAARADAWLAARPAQPGLWTGIGVLALLAWCVAIPAIWCKIRGIAFEATITRTWYLFFGIIWSALLLALLHGHGGWTRVFAWRPLRWVGLVSFSLYLWHMPVLYALMRSGLIERFSLLAPLLVLAGALTVSALSWWLFERPQRGIRYRRRRH